jgi:hypothetical protein
MTGANAAQTGRRAPLLLVGLPLVGLLLMGLFAALACALAEGEQQTEGLPEGIAWREPTVVAAGGGLRGPWRMNESEYDYLDDATVAIDGAGTVAVAWVDQRLQDVLLQIYDRDGNPRFDAPVNVSRSSEIFSWLPRVAFIGEGSAEIAVLWQEIVFSGGSHGGDIFFARSADGGQTFSQPLNLSNTLGGAGKGRLTVDRWENGSMALAVGSRGQLYAAWTEYEGRLLISRSTDAGQTFSAPLLVAGTSQLPTRAPALAIGPEGRVHLAWTVGEDPRADIRVAISDDEAASFGPPRTVGQSAGHADAPGMLVDAQGTVHLVFAHSPEGPFGRSELRYTRASGDELRFEEPRLLAEGAGYPALALDGEQALYVLWERLPAGGGRARGLGLARSTDGGESFGASGVVPGSVDPELRTNGNLQGSLTRKLAVNDGGELAVVNNSYRANQASRIWLFRGHRQ